MHANAPDFATQFAADIQHYQRDALQTIHKLMLHLSQSLTGDKPQEDDDDEHAAAQARNTTQRIRLTLQAARDLLRFRPPINGDTQTPSAANQSSDSPRTRPWRKPGQGQAGTPKAQATQASAQSPPHTDAAQFANKLLAVAGAEVSRFGEGGRIDSPPDSRLSTHDSLPSIPPPDSSPIAHTPAPAPPPPLTTVERDLLAASQKHGKRFVPFQVLPSLRAWQRYADATGTKPPFNVPRESIFPAKQKQRAESA